MASHFRTDRVGMEIKREVNEILQKKVRDPRVQGVTITDVQMLGDLSMYLNQSRRKLPHPTVTFFKFKKGECKNGISVHEFYL